MSNQVLPAPVYDTPSGKRAIYYYPNWVNYGRKVFVKDIPVGQITDISYAFFDVKEDGIVYSKDEWADYGNTFPGNSVVPLAADAPERHKGCLGQFMLLHEAGNRFNLSIAIGGWTWSKYFSPAVSTAANRQRFVDSLVALFRRYPGLFNGISLDWEYLSDNGINYGLDGNIATPSDAVNFIELLKLIKATLPGFLIAFCVGPAPEKMHMPIKDISGYIDQLHAMAYDYAGFSGEVVTAHHTNPRKSSVGKYSAEESADLYIKAGVPASKIFTGGAFYSRGFSGTDGFGKPATGGISTDFEFAEEPGILPYRMLPAPGATEFLDPESKGAYSFDPVKRIVNTYDNPESLGEKIKIIHEKGLGGIIIWEIAGDIRDYTNPRSLRRFLTENLTHKIPAPSIATTLASTLAPWTTPPSGGSKGAFPWKIAVGVTIAVLVLVIALCLLVRASKKRKT